MAHSILLIKPDSENAGTFLGNGLHSHFALPILIRVHFFHGICIPLSFRSQIDALPEGHLQPAHR